MATIQLHPPEAFNFNNPDDWPKWKRRFELYRLASGLSKEAEERQVSAFLYCLGEDAEDVLVSTNISSDDKKVYGRVIAKFDTFFKVRKKPYLNMHGSIGGSKLTENRPNNSLPASINWQKTVRTETLGKK